MTFEEYKNCQDVQSSLNLIREHFGIDKEVVESMLLMAFHAGMNHERHDKKYRPKFPKNCVDKTLKELTS